jgi:dsDNA-binding SOS-regulon protein
MSTLPACMTPDVAAPCDSYTRLLDERDRLNAEVSHLSALLDESVELLSVYLAEAREKRQAHRVSRIEYYLEKLESLKTPLKAPATSSGSEDQKT